MILYDIIISIVFYKFFIITHKKFKKNAQRWFVWILADPSSNKEQKNRRQDFFIYRIS